MSGGETTDEDWEDERDLWLEEPSEDDRSLSLSPMNCEGEGRMVSTEVPGWKSTDKVREAEIRLPSTRGGKARSSSENEAEEPESERERSVPELGISMAPARE